MYLSRDIVSVAAIVAEGLTKSFGEGAARMTAVDGANFTVNFGEMIFVVGPSGSGKTTFLSMCGKGDAGQQTGACWIFR